MKIITQACHVLQHIKDTRQEVVLQRFVDKNSSSQAHKIRPGFSPKVVRGNWSNWMAPNEPNPNLVRVPIISTGPGHQAVVQAQG